MTSEEILLDISDVMRAHNKPHGVGITDDEAVQQIKDIILKSMMEEEKCWNCSFENLSATVCFTSDTRIDNHDSLCICRNRFSLLD